MQLVPGGQPTGRGEGHARDAGPEAIQGCSPVGVLSGIDGLDDQTHALLLSQLKLFDGLQDTWEKTASVIWTMRL
jgi:hypothetical protein